MNNKKPTGLFGNPKNPNRNMNRNMNRIMDRKIGRSVCPAEVCVSLFQSYNDPIPIGTIPLADFLLQPTYKTEVEVLRQYDCKARRRELKLRLPAITPSGVFSHRRNEGLIKHSGFICIDLDAQDNPGVTDWEALKSSISDLPGLWYAGLSASGNGLFLLFLIAHLDRHVDHFHALARDLRGRGLVVDAACKDVARLRGASYDLNPLYYLDTEPYEGLMTPERESVPHDSRPPQNGDLTALRVGKLVDTIERHGTNITELYPDWFAVGRSLASEFGESGRGWFHSISRQSSKYNPAGCDQQYTRCLRTCDHTSIATLFMICKQNGITL